MGSWLLFAVLFVAMFAAAGCVVQPVVAGENPGLGLVSNGEPVIAVAPTAAPSGTTIEVAGAGWEAEETVYVNLEGDSAGEKMESTVAVTKTDKDGRFSVNFILPLELFWQNVDKVAIVAYSLDTSARTSTPFTFLVGAQTPSPSATSVITKTPVPTATPIPLPNNQGTVLSRGLNMRSGPGTIYPVLRVLNFGTPFTVLGQDRSGAALCPVDNQRPGLGGACLYKLYRRRARDAGAPTPNPPYANLNADADAGFRHVARRVLCQSLPFRCAGLRTQ
ncbi:MAG: SH3 domain-containing protein [Anaerolineales bacterium]|nr:SH3 domain-containing protein [Anaerolineales bacterium]